MPFAWLVSECGGAAGADQIGDLHPQRARPGLQAGDDGGDVVLATVAACHLHQLVGGGLG